MRQRLQDVARAPGRLANNVSVATRLSFVVVVVALVSVVVTSLVGLQRGRELADDQIQDRLAGVAAARVAEVNTYIAGIERAVVGQALSPRSASAIEVFSGLFDDLNADSATRRDRVSVENYYRDVVAPELTRARGRPVDPTSLVPVSAAAVTLQAEYVVPDGDDTPPDGLPDWAAVHDPLDQSFREFVIRSGVDDFYLIEPKRHVVVYSTSKEIDFATSLRSGPESGGGLAALIREIEDAPEPGVASTRDFSQYAPAGLSPNAFAAAPVYADGELAGYVAVRFGPQVLTSIMTGDQSWVALDEAGEAYIAGDDNLMRSDARGFLQNEAAYVDAIEASGTATDDQLRLMRLFDTTVLFQPIDYRQVADALEEDAAVVEATNYLGEEVLSARRALDIDGVEWAVFAEASLDAIEQPIDDFVRNLLITIAIFIVFITFLAVRWADRLLRPLRIISDRLRAMRSGSVIRADSGLPDRSAREFVELSDDIDTMVGTLRARSGAANRRADERRRVLRRLLPPQIAERAEAGDRDVVEQIPNATVAVVVINGLGSLMEARSPSTARSILDHLVEEADDLAASRGLDRVRLTGDAYVAVCGATRPHLDHAARAALFAIGVRELVEDLDDLVSVGVGIDSGPITVGLTGGSRLVHDTWGSTVARANDLARRARPQQILVSASVSAQLPTYVEREDTADDDVAAVLGMAEENETV